MVTEASIGYSVILVTVASQEEGMAIAQALVSEQLAACVNFFPVKSVYTWQGQIQQDEEWQLVIKTHRSIFPKLESRIRQLHSYEVPEIIALPLEAGSAPYLHWISKQVQG